MNNSPLPRPVPYPDTPAPPHAAGPRRRRIWRGIAGGLVALLAAFVLVALFVVRPGSGTATATAAPTRTPPVRAASLTSTIPVATFQILPPPAVTARAPTPASTAAAGGEATAPAGGALNATQPPSPLGYVANFPRWGRADAPDGSARGFPGANAEYHVQAFGDGRGEYYYLPDNPTFGDFVAEVDARRVAGPNDGWYGVAFRRQPLRPGEVYTEHYTFHITSSGFFEFLLIMGDGTVATLQPRAASTAIKPGNAVNHLKVTCKADQITLEINGTIVGTYVAAITSAGGFGIGADNTAGGPGMEAAFKDLHIVPVA